MPLSRLAGYSPPAGISIFIDELHFFPDAVPETLRLQQSGVNVTATTLDVDGEGNDFLLRKLEEAGVLVTAVHLEGKCAFPGCDLLSCRTSRLTPVGSSWLGGAESYQPHCLVHHI